MLTKAVPLYLSGSTKADLSSAQPALGRLGYQKDSDNSLLLGNGTQSPYEYPPKHVVSRMISDALSNLSTSGTGLLITAPSVSGATAALSGQSVTLTAQGSQYLWGGSAGITYKWTKGDGSVVTGSTVSVLAGQSATVIATDANNNKSPSVNVSVAISTNSPPNINALAHNLPSRLTRSTVYNYTLVGAIDDKDSAALLQYNIDTAACVGINTLTLVAGVNGTQRGFTVNADATMVKLVVYVTDSGGAESVRKTFTWDAALLDNPVLSSGVLGPGTYTVNVPAGNYAIIARGGLGSRSTETSCEGNVCYTYNGSTSCSCLGGAGSDCGCSSYYSYAAGAATTVKSGSTTIQSVAGSSPTSAGYNTLPSLTTYVKTAATALSLTVTVGANNGQCEIQWG